MSSQSSSEILHHAGPPALFGRAAERSRLRNILARADRGQGGLVLVSGEAGIGKTTLLEDLGRVAMEQGATVLTGRCYDLTVTPPYGPWIEAFSERGGEPSPPLLATGDRDTPSQDWLFRQVLLYLHDLAAEGPLVIALDDAHWADQASLDLVRFIGRDINSQPIILIVSYRTDVMSRQHPLYVLLPNIVREARPDRIDLKRLTAEDMQAWIASRYDLPESEQAALVTYLVGTAEGHPFYASEILRSIEEDGILRQSSEGWTVADLSTFTIPTLLQQVVEDRLRRVSEQTRQLLTTAAVIGHDIAIDVLKAVANTPEDFLIEAVDDAADAWLVLPAPDGRSIVFRHSLFREALYQSVSPLRRRLYHQRVAEVLAERPDPDPDAVSYHFRQAGDLRAIEWLIQAGDRAWHGWAWTEAAIRYQAAIELLAKDPNRTEERAWVLLRLAETRRYNSPRLARQYTGEAEHIAIALSDPALQATATWVRGRIRVAVEEDGLTDLEAAVVEMRKLPRRDQLRILQRTGTPVEHTPALLSVWLAIGGRYQDALQASMIYLSLAPDARNPLMDAEAQLARGIAFGALGDRLASRRAFAEALDIYTRLQVHFSTGHTAFLFLIETILPYEADNIAERRRLVEVGDGAWSQAAQISITQAPIVAPPVLLLEGQWEQLRQITSRTVGVRNYVRVWTAPFGAAVARYRGDRALARAYIEAGLVQDFRFDGGSIWISMTLMNLRQSAEIALEEEDLSVASEWITRHGELLEASGRVAGRAEHELLQGQLELLNGNLGAAQDRGQAALQRARNPRQPLALLAAHHFLGNLRFAGGQMDDAQQHLEEAASLAQACRAVYERARVQTSLAAVHLKQDQIAAAISLLGEARSTACELKAAPLLEQIELLLGQATASRSGKEYPAGLTEREVEVLRLVTEGHTDAEIADHLSISPRTVMSHVSNILNKTGASSRAAAAAFAVRNELA